MVNKKYITQDSIEKIIGNCVADLGFEGLICTDEDKDAMRRIITGKTALNDELDAVVLKYRKE